MKYFLTGLGTGIVIGMMVASRRSRETRGRAREFARESVSRARRPAIEVSDIGELIAQPSTRPTPNWREILSESRKPASMAFTEKAVAETMERVEAPEQDVVRVAPVSFLAIVNEWPQERLIEIDGIGPKLAAKIISNRPYKSAEELAKSKLLPPSAIEALRKAS